MTSREAAVGDTQENVKKSPCLFCHPFCYVKSGLGLLFTAFTRAISYPSLRAQSSHLRREISNTCGIYTTRQNENGGKKWENNMRKGEGSVARQEERFAKRLAAGQVFYVGRSVPTWWAHPHSPPSKSRDLVRYKGWLQTRPRQCTPLAHRVGLLLTTRHDTAQDTCLAVSRHCLPIS